MKSPAPSHRYITLFLNHSLGIELVEDVERDARTGKDGTDTRLPAGKELDLQTLACLIYQSLSLHYRDFPDAIFTRTKKLFAAASQTNIQ